MHSVQGAKLVHILLSGFMGCVGIFLLMHPVSSVLFACRLVAAAILLVSCAKLIGYFSNDLYRLAFQFDFALGIFGLLVGILLLARPDVVARLIPIILGLYILLESAFRLQTALDARHFGLSCWGLLLVSAIVSGIIGGLVLFDPFGAASLLTQFAGAGLLLVCIQDIVSTLLTVKGRRQDR